MDVEKKHTIYVIASRRPGQNVPQSVILGRIPLNLDGPSVRLLLGCRFRLAKGTCRRRIHKVPSGERQADKDGEFGILCGHSRKTRTMSESVDRAGQALQWSERECRRPELIP